MNLNVFDKINYRYIFRSKPWELPIQFGRDLIRCKDRITKGYCDRDCWAIDEWFLEVMPNMLTHLNENKHGEPYSFAENLEDRTWDEVLDEIIFLLKEASEEKTTYKNPYQEEYDKASEEFSKKYGFLGEKLRTEEEKEKGIHLFRSVGDLPEYEELSNNYFKAEIKKHDYMEASKDMALDLFKKYFRDLWD